MTPTPSDAEPQRRPTLPRPVPVPPRIEGWTEEDQRIVDEFDAQRTRDEVNGYDPYA